MLQTNDKNGQERPWVQIVDVGVANRYSYSDHDEIEINKALLECPELLKGIMKHELAHTTGRYKLKDLWLDLHDGIKKPGYRKFIITHPSTWHQFSPIWFSKQKGIVLDMGSLSNWLILLCAFWVILKLWVRVLI